MKTTTICLPLKYVPMPIYENDNIVVYISAKCYLIEEHKKYLPNNQEITTYDIVFCYNQDKTNNKPIFNLNKCINSINVDLIFESLKQCKNYTKELNNKLLLDQFAGKTYNEMILIYNNKEMYFQKYYELEKELTQENKIIDFQEYKSIKLTKNIKKKKS